jgi:hypothetical protein
MQHTNTSVHTITTKRATFTFNNMDADDLRDCIVAGLVKINDRLRIRWERGGEHAALYMHGSGDYIEIDVADPADWFFNIAEAVQILLHPDHITVDLNMTTPTADEQCKFTVTWTWETSQGEVLVSPVPHNHTMEPVQQGWRGDLIR